MKLIAITQRVELEEATRERRDALDQRWVLLLQELGFTTIPLPNNTKNAISLLQALPIQGIILSGGNSLVEYEGNAPERDEVEYALLHYAKQQNLPLLGVCRGMQLIQHQENISLQRIKGHVCNSINITCNNIEKVTNSYHNWGAYESSPLLKVYASSKDGVIKAVKHTQYPIEGIMWHPERCYPFAEDDLKFIKRFFT